MCPVYEIGLPACSPEEYKKIKEARKAKVEAAKSDKTEGGEKK